MLSKTASKLPTAIFHAELSGKSLQFLPIFAKVSKSSPITVDHVKLFGRSSTK